MNRVCARGRRYLALARALDRVDRVKPVERPEPKPPVAARPRSLSVTEIETLIRDPYAIYARRVLRLEPLDPLGRTPDAALRGTLVHDALADFTREWSGPFDAAAEARLLAIGRQTLAAVADFPDVLAIWSLRFAAIARWFVAWEAARDGAVARRHAEIDGALDFSAPAGSFRLKGRADRVDLMRDGSIAIYDFKTGTPPSERQVFAGLTPQMTLEAAMARGGAFAPEFMGRSVSALAWLGLGKVGRGEPCQSAVKKGETADRLGERAFAMLKALAAAFDAADRGYLSRARPMMERARYTGDYDHLARVREWALVESEEDLL
jgi:ATP-dependent helicase/nuclease subunit B